MAHITGMNQYYALGLVDYNTVGSTNAIANQYKNLTTGSTHKTTQSNSLLSAEETRSYMAAIKNLGGKLANTASTLSTAANKSIYSQLVGSSSNSEAISVEVAKQADATKVNQSKTTKQVSVQQLAAAQQNTGETVNATQVSGVQTGNNQFTLEKGDKTYTLNVNVKSTDSARTVQQKTADAINNQNIGITASVAYDEKTKKSALVLTAKDTGEQNAFKVQDVEGKGNLISTLGVGEATKKAKDAVYTVDGVEKTSAKNTVDLGDGLTGTLKKVTDKDVEAGTKRDPGAVNDAISSLVNDFNNLRATAEKYDKDKGAQNLAQKLDSMVSAYGSGLQRLGISKDEDGYLQIDSDKLSKAIDNGTAERYLSDTSGGFARRVEQVAKATEKSPDQFVSLSSRRNAVNENYNYDDYANYLTVYKNTQLSNLNLLLNASV